MKRAKRWLLIFAALVALLSHFADLAKPPFNRPALLTTTTTAKSTSASTTTTTTTEATIDDNETTQKSSGNASTSATGKKLTGIPQIDYIWDPNLPRELHGHNLSTYPFFNSVPPEEEIHFKCDGLHDGFYASIEHNCQLYHHCIYGIRHDFLCANFTAFDQRTFICHFVSEVDCKNSDKFWHRNDNLYMATTTKSTTTTTTEAPSTVAPVRRRPGRRPLRRRRPMDYYYDDDDYDVEYYEERVNRRRKQRPRNRKPLTDYDDDYEDKHLPNSDEDKRHTISRDHSHDDELEEDYEIERKKYDRPRSWNKSDTRAERRKLTGRRSSTSAVGVRAGLDEGRRSLSDEKINRKKKPLSDESLDVIDPPRRSAGGRWRISGERSDDYEKPQDEAVNLPTNTKQIPEIVKPDLVKPQSSGSSSVPSIYDRPRAAPRIARPVPINEKKKFQYQKTTAAPIASDEEYYNDEEEYEDLPGRGGHPESSRRRNYQDYVGGKKVEDDIEPLPPRKIVADSPRPLRKPLRSNSRKPIRERKPLIEDEYYEEPAVIGKGFNRRRPLKDRPPVSAPSGRGNQDFDFIDEEYEDSPREHRLRVKVTSRKQLKKVATPLHDDEQPPTADLEERPQRNRDHPKITTNQRNNSNRHHSEDHLSLSEDEEIIYEDEKDKPKDSYHTTRTPVRIVKRPFLPSRGGSPYLPRGLQPVGGAIKESSTTLSTPIDMGSTISGSRLLEHGVPLLRNTGSIDHIQKVQTDTATVTPVTSKENARVTQTPIQNTAQHDIPKVSLDELYETDYDVTLNDALNPTLKPIAPSNRNFPSAFTTLPNHDHNSNNQNPKTLIVPINNYNSDSYFTSTDIRRRTILAPSFPRNTRTEYRPGSSSRISQHFYDDPDY